MWTTEKDDELRNKLRYDLILWYEHWYMGSTTVLNKHLELFDAYYDPSLFDNPETKKENIRKFMIFLQTELDKEQIE
jgi:hypothetical protein